MKNEDGITTKKKNGECGRTKPYISQMGSSSWRILKEDDTMDPKFQT